MSKSSLAVQLPGTEPQNLPRPSGLSAKADLFPKDAESLLRVIAKETIQRGKQSSAASEIGISEGRLSAKLGDGTLTLAELEKLGLNFAVIFAEEVLRLYGPLSTPQARVRQLIRGVRQSLDEIEQYLEHLS